jgi:tetratricopeptide (TPR) repeat protein
MLTLHALFFSPAAEGERTAAAMVGDMVAYGGPWAQDLAHRFFQAADVPDDWKMAAAEGLVRAGVLDDDEPVAMLIGGQHRRVVITKHEWVFDPEPDLDASYREAVALREAGRLDEARRSLEALVRDTHRLYFPAVAAYTTLLLDQGDRKEARRWLEMMRAVAPGHPGVLYNLAVLNLEEGDREAARRCLSEIDREDLPAGLAERISAFERHLDRPLFDLTESRRMLARFAEDSRADIDARPIAADRVTLERALAREPAEWLNAACALYSVEAPARLKRDRARQLSEVIVADPQAALQALAHLDRDGRARDLLRYVLAEGGVAAKRTVVRRFGSDAGDGFWWTATPPESPLGRLRLAGLAFVGQAVRDGRRERVVVVPADMREALAGALPPES